MKKYILFDHDGVLVDTELWYFKAGERALADIGLAVDRDQYLLDMSQGLGTWTQAKAAGVDGRTINRQREIRNAYYQEYLRTEAIEIDGVVEVLAELSQYVRMANGVPVWVALMEEDRSWFLLATRGPLWPRIEAESAVTPQNSTWEQLLPYEEPAAARPHPVMGLVESRPMTSPEGILIRRTPGSFFSLGESRPQPGRRALKQNCVTEP